jgi:hypothetical protein
MPTNGGESGLESHEGGNDKHVKQRQRCLIAPGFGEGFETNEGSFVVEIFQVDPQQVYISE